jgi:lipoate-protein ligase B
VFIERGGDVTYHGPGQLVVYFIFNLTRRGRDLHLFMSQLQDGIISILDKYGITARKDDEHTGIWVDDRKIASIGIAIKNWITFHGVAINLNTDLTEFQQIHPCGLEPKVMTSVASMTNKKVNMKKFGDQLIGEYERIFETNFESISLDHLAEEIESQAGGYTI